MDLKLSYRNRKVYLNLVLGVLWLGIGISYFFEQNSQLKYKPYVVTFLGLCYLLVFIYEYTQNYIEITENKIIHKGFTKKEIYLNELIDVKYSTGKFYFKSEKQTIEIMKSQINNNQLSQFERFFNDLTKKIE